ncbi:hypothetical protein GQ54DRAFT_305059 [Martensiomyces pterosporus]|nr:hypothetical protein GQ54DRAFT_305059 [Martensiomyces pterosporus]
MPGQESLLIEHQLVSIRVPVDSSLLSLGQRLVASFTKGLGDTPVADVELYARFLEHCTSKNSELTLAVFGEFKHAFCADTDVHSVVQQHNLDKVQIRAVLRGYYSAWDLVQSHKPMADASSAAKPALFSDPSVSLMALFGGQGGMDNYMDEARWLWDAYRPLLLEFVTKASAFLEHESRDPRVAELYDKGLSPIQWLKDPDSLPSQEYLLTIPISMPVVGLIQLMHVVTAYKTLGVSPGELARSFKAAAGHSQGIAIAAALSMATDDASFYAVAEKVLGTLLLASAYPQLEYPYHPLSPSDEADVLTDGQTPYPMVSVQGVSKRVLEGYIAEFNSDQPERGSTVNLSLVNTYDQFIWHLVLPPSSYSVQ